LRAAQGQAIELEVLAVRRPLRPFARPFWLRFAYAPSGIVKKY
jgi:hypothetical protein